MYLFSRKKIFAPSFTIVMKISFQILSTFNKCLRIKSSLFMLPRPQELIKQWRNDSGTWWFWNVTILLGNHHGPSHMQHLCHAWECHRDREHAAADGFPHQFKARLGNQGEGATLLKECLDEEVSRVLYSSYGLNLSTQTASHPSPVGDFKKWREIITTLISRVVSES